MKDIYASYKDVKSYLQIHMKDNEVPETMKAAAAYFKANGKIIYEKKAIFEGYDITKISDEDFEKMLDELPVRMNDSLFNGMEDLNRLIPEMNRCYLIRILNEVPKTLHSHNFLEIAYVWSGSCTIQCDDNEYHLKKGDFLLVSPNKEHSVDVNNRDSIIFNFIISRETFGNILLGVLALDHAISFYIKNNIFGNGKKGALYIDNLGEHGDNLVRQIFKMAMAECYSENMGHLLMIDALVSQLLCVMIKFSPSFITFDDDGDEKVSTVLEYIQKNYNTITMHELADFFGYTESYLCRLIKQATGKTFSEIIRIIRINKAKNYLSNSNVTVKMAAEALGYNSTSVFIRAFQKETGMTPANYIICNQNM